MLLGELIVAVPIAQLLALALPLGRIDAQMHRLPNVFTFPALATAQLALFAASALDSSWGRYFWAMAALAAVSGLGFAAALSGALGMGDVKLVASTVPLLAWFDPLAAVSSVAIAFGLAAAAVLALGLAGRVSWHSRVALGPYLLAGFIGGVGLLLGGAEFLAY
jgi:leader peptidase (prepilin peptidase) / N-methyltransferase